MSMLEYVFDSREKVRILKFFAKRKEWIFSLSELSKELKIPRNTLIRNISSLIEQNILREFKKDRGTVLQLNVRNYVVTQIIMPLFENELEYPLKKASEFCMTVKKQSSGKISAAIVFGSAAEGTMMPTSDIDIALISENPKIAEALAEKLKSKYFKEEEIIFSVHVFRPKEFKEKHAKKDPLITNIAKGKVIFGD